MELSDAAGPETGPVNSDSAGHKSACISEACRLLNLLPMEADGAEAMLRPLVAIAKVALERSFDEGVLSEFVTSHGATAAMCVSVISEYIEAGHAAAALAGLATALSRFPTDCEDLVGCLLNIEVYVDTRHR